MISRVSAWVVLGALALSVAATAPAIAAPGDRDASFGVNGIARLDLGAAEYASAMALQPDGRVLVGGNRYPAIGGDAVVARVTTAGALDPTYGGGAGWSLLDTGATDLTGRGLALAADGRIVVAGDIGGDLAVARLLNPEGTFDPAFGGGDGWESANLGANEYAFAVAPRPQGPIVAAGWGSFPGNADMVVAQFQASGPLDPGFAGGTGWSRLDFGGNNDYARAVALQPDGRVVVAGLSVPAAGGSLPAVARLLSPEGTFDPSFGTGGTGRFTASLGTPGEAEAVAIRPDGTILAAGSADAPGGSDVSVVGLLPAGTPDAGWAGDGTLEAPAPGVQRAYAVALQPDGKVLVAGSTRAPGAVQGDLLVMRLQPGGILDTTFGAGGRATVDLGADDQAVGVAALPDGRIVAAGESDDGNTSDLAVVRLQGDGTAVGGPGAGPGGGAAARPRCAGRLATIIGTPRRDVLRGTPRADVIAALGGDDAVRALRGNDVVCGGPGRDALLGGPGADRLRGQAGADRLAGGPGRDLLLGGAGPDRLAGGRGVDVLRGGPGRDLTRR